MSLCVETAYTTEDSSEQKEFTDVHRFLRLGFHLSSKDKLFVETILIYSWTLTIFTEKLEKYVIINRYNIAWEYNFREIEKKWQQRWVERKTYKVVEDESKKKFYVLNMFPYPSGAGLHEVITGIHCQRYLCTLQRFAKGFNVLNPMGYDAYGLPAEQYAIQTASIRPLLPQLTLHVIASSWTRLVFRLTGIVRYVRANLDIITGHSGLSRKCSTASL